MLYAIKLFGISLALTCALEIPVGLCFGLRTGRQLALLLLVNLLTNPAAVLLSSVLGLPQPPVEIGVIALEAAVYIWFSKDGKWTIPHPLLLSVTANLTSWMIGFFLQL